MEELTSLHSKKSSHDESLLTAVNQTDLSYHYGSTYYTLDLVNSTRVGKVEINETEGANVEVRVGDSENLYDNPRCQGPVDTNETYDSAVVSCDLQGRYVSVSVTGESATLNVTDVQVWALPSLGTELVLLKQYVKQSSTWRN